ncbi:unnamed protein product [Trichogramma brassicae]|uniref:Uncharacterized protein n=1 Tax=Trichogramma brassicae TaxID=86971 RepID=A0A6H5ITE3_9HYME|nr:unnamed protein product [Trichogramma brassicae]
MNSLTNKSFISPYWKSHICMRKHKHKPSYRLPQRAESKRSQGHNRSKALALAWNSAARQTGVSHVGRRAGEARAASRGAANRVKKAATEETGAKSRCHVGRQGPTSDAARNNESDEHSSSATATVGIMARPHTISIIEGTRRLRKPSSDLNLIRQDEHTEYPTGRVPCTPSSFRLFNDIVKQIPKFDGKPNTLKLLCTAVEEAVEQLPFSSKKIVRALQPKLVGDAQYIVGNLADYQNAQELLRDLRDRFVNRNVADGLAMQLGSAKQQAGEDVRKFGVTIRSLYDNVVAAYRQAPDLNAFERESAIYSLQSSVVDCFLYGLLEPLKMEVRIKNPKTLAEAIEVAGETERKLRYRSVTGSNITSVGLIGVPCARNNPVIPMPATTNE